MRFLCGMVLCYLFVWMSWVFANDHHIRDVEDRTHAVFLSVEPLRAHHLQSFVLDAQAITLLQESSPLHAQAKE